MPYPSSVPKVDRSSVKLYDRPARAPGKFAFPVSPRIDLFLGCKMRPAVPVSFTAPPHVTLETMNRDDDFILMLRIEDPSVTQWLKGFREFVMEQCEERPELFGFKDHFTWELGSAVKLMGSDGQIAVRVPQDGSPYPPHIQFCKTDEEARYGPLRNGTVAELARMPAETLKRAKVVPQVQISHLWQDNRGHCGICPRLARMIIMVPDDTPSPFARLGSEDSVLWG